MVLSEPQLFPLTLATPCGSASSIPAQGGAGTSGNLDVSATPPAARTIGRSGHPEAAAQPEGRSKHDYAGGDRSAFTGVGHPRDKRRARLCLWLASSRNLHRHGTALPSRSQGG